MFKFAHKLAGLAIYTGLCLGIASTITPITSPVFAEDSSLGIFMRRGHLRVGISPMIHCLKNVVT
ncbi:MAG: hypothetical protein ACOYMQ_12335 [Pseudanabaena sp.]